MFYIFRYSTNLYQFNKKCVTSGCYFNFYMLYCILYVTLIFNYILNKMHWFVHTLINLEYFYIKIPVRQLSIIWEIHGLFLYYNRQFPLYILCLDITIRVILHAIIVTTEIHKAYVPKLFAFAIVPVTNYMAAICINHINLCWR